MSALKPRWEPWYIYQHLPEQNHPTVGKYIPAPWFADGKWCVPQNHEQNIGFPEPVEQKIMERWGFKSPSYGEQPVVLKTKSSTLVMANIWVCMKIVYMVND